MVRIRNVSRKTFLLKQAADPFYFPKIGQLEVHSGGIEIPPGFDEPCEGLVIPWAVTSNCGLSICEAGISDSEVRCVVGPSPKDEGWTDWLQFHDSSWQSIEEARWLPLGKRHLLGTIGGSVELHLTLREPPRDIAEPQLLGSHLVSLERRANEGGEISGTKGQSPDADVHRNALQTASSIHFEREVACASACTVFLNVYDLVSATSVVNSLLCNTLVKTFGAFHAAVEVYGDEWGFYRQPDPADCGICRSRQPRWHPVHVYRQSVNLGETNLKDWEVWERIKTQKIPLWPSGRYDLIHCNCIHFCDDFVQMLGVQPVPAWVRNLHETGAAILRIPTWSPLSLFTGESSAPAIADSSSTHSRGVKNPDNDDEDSDSDDSDDAIIQASAFVDTLEDVKAAGQSGRRPSTSDTAESNDQGAGPRPSPKQDSSTPKLPLRRPKFLPDPLPGSRSFKGTFEVGSQPEDPQKGGSENEDDVASFASVSDPPSSPPEALRNPDKLSRKT